jgi:peptidylprolyl isomerase
MRSMRPRQSSIVPRPAKRLGAVLALIGVLSGCGGGGGEAEAGPLPPSDPSQLFYAPELEVDLSEFERRSSGLYVQDVTVGEGPVARRTSRVWVHYVGWLPDGAVFDASLGGDPYHTRLGGNEVIRGWNEGIVGMRRGGIRRLVVPPRLGYGSSGRAGVPPNATLIFRLELIDVD